MIRLSDLSPEQIRLMVKLDDGFDHIDSVGVRRSALSAEEDVNLLALIIDGLADIDDGYAGVTWARFTKRGRKLREEGWV